MPREDTVERVMSSPVIDVDAGATLREAQERMERVGVHHLVVTHRDRAVGVVSDRDVLRHISPFVGTLSEQARDAHTLLRRVFQFATYQLVTVRSDAPLEEVAALLLERNISCLPVVDDGDIVGVVTTRDLLRGMLECPLPARA